MNLSPEVENHASEVTNLTSEVINLSSEVKNHASLVNNDESEVNNCWLKSPTSVLKLKHPAIGKEIIMHLGKDSSIYGNKYSI